MSRHASPIRPWPGMLLGSDTINRGLMAAFMPSNAAGGGMVDIGPHKLHARPGAAAVRTGSQRVGSALNFNGSSQYLTTRAPNAGGSTGPHTVVAWVRPNFSSATNAIYNVVIRGAGSTYGQRIVWVSAAVGWYSDNVSGGAGAAFQTGAATPSFSAGEWHLIGFVYNNGGTFYWDGKPVATTGPLFGTWPNANLAGKPFYIGRDVTASQYWNGDLGPIRQFTRGLHAAEMWRLYQRRSTGLARPRNASWWVGAPSGTIVSLTGSALTTSAGSVAEGIAVAATGSAATSAAGTPTSAIASTLAGSAGTAAAGTATSGIGMSLTGEALTVSAGSLSYTIGFTLTGSAATSAGGTLTSSGGDTNTERSLTGIRMTALPGNVRVTGGTRWRPSEAQAVTPPSMVGNTLQPPPRLVGDPAADNRAIQQWLQTLYDHVIKRDNVLGRIADHETRIAAIEATDDTGST